MVPPSKKKGAGAAQELIMLITVYRLIFTILINALSRKRIN